MYSSIREFIPSVDPNFVAAVEPLLLQNKVSPSLHKKYLLICHLLEEKSSKYTLFFLEKYV